VTGIGAM